MNITSTIYLALAITLAFAFSTPSVYAKDFYEKLDDVSEQTLVLQTDSGSILINTHHKNTLIVDVTIGDNDSDKFNISVERKDNKILVNGERPGSNNWGKWRGPNVKFIITVPETFSLDLKTAGGSIVVDDLEGDIKAKTSGGSIKIGNILGNVDIHTSGGSIKTKNIQGHINAHTSGGSIEVIFAQQPTQDASLTTSGGSIKAKFPKDIAMNLSAKTSGGRVSSEFNVSGKVKKQSIVGQINGGGPKIILKTSGGSVSVTSI